MKQKHYLLLYGWAYALIAAFLIGVALTTDPDSTGYILGAVLICVLSFKSYSCFKKIKTTNNEDRAYAPPANATIGQQLQFYKRYMMVFWIAITLLSVMCVSDMNDFISGNFEYVGVWKPVLVAYGIGGYWLAVSITPLIGIIITLLYLKKRRDLRKQAEAQQ